MTTLTFQNKPISVTNHQNQIWLTVSELGKALGYADHSRNVKSIYERHQDEFTPCMTQLVEMQTAGGMQKVRIFSLRGCHLIGMLSHTKAAKDFRRWVLDILDRELSQKSTEIAPLVPEPEPTYQVELTEYELEQLAWLCFSHKQMNELLGILIEPLDALGSRFSASVYSHHHEYKRHYNESVKTIQRIIAPFKDSTRANWTRVIPRLTD